MQYLPRQITGSGNSHMTRDTDDHPPLYTPENYTPLRNVGRYVADIAGDFRDLLDRRAAPLGISGAQWTVLIRIFSSDGITASELCRAMGYDSGSMTRMLDRLEKAGFISRMRCADDRRIINILMTDRGRELYPQLAPIAIETLNDGLKGFSAEEEEELVGFLHRIRANLRGE